MAAEALMGPLRSRLVGANPVGLIRCSGRRPIVASRSLQSLARPRTLPARLPRASVLASLRPRPRWQATLAAASDLERIEPAASTSDEPLPTVADPAVRTHLLVVASLVFSIVVLGGLTRLTESGLSITEWQLVTGVLPPRNAAEWDVELAKYRATPEGRLLNKNITMSEFKRIYLYEYSHRLLGRVIGLAFLLPIPYFIARRRLSRRAGIAYLGLAGLIGGQGALGWYMVKSGLDEQLIAEANPSGVPRVSQYRLAAHLGMAFAVYAGCLRLALGVGRDASATRGGPQAWVRLGLAKLGSPTAARTRMLVTGMTGLVFLTAVSGAFVAGLDAGLLYNTFPLMDGRLIPPTEELFSPAYVRPPSSAASVGALVRRNVFENPTTVQFDHRVLATTTWVAAVALAAFASRGRIAASLPRSTVLWTRGIAAMATMQAALGISTLVYLVPTPLAAAHQAGSLVLLSLCIAAGASLRRPGLAARRWLVGASTPRPVDLTLLARPPPPPVLRPSAA